MPKIAFVHTASIHIDTFETLLSALTDPPADLSAHHEVHADWLERASHPRSDGGVDGRLDDVLRDEVSAHLSGLAVGSDMVICTCSTLGPIVEQLGLDNVVRVDQPMMDEAAGCECVLLVMCLHSTLRSSTDLLAQAFARQEKAPNIVPLICDHAWPLFESDDQAGFADAIALSVREAVTADIRIDCVVLAQASMHVAQARLGDLLIPVLSSPSRALARALGEN